MIIIIVLKLNSGVYPGQSAGHWSRPELRVRLTQVSVRIKIVIIIIFKPDSGVDLGQDPSHEWS
jgi:hypothetical protein